MVSFQGNPLLVHSQHPELSFAGGDTNSLLLLKGIRTPSILVVLGGSQVQDQRGWANRVGSPIQWSPSIFASVGLASPLTLWLLNCERA